MTEAITLTLTVTELNRLARLALEKSLLSCWVHGEISNLTRASSGHWYFTLKDAQATVRCAMFRARNQFVESPPREGDHVEVRGQATLFEPRGDYQFIVDSMRLGGQGKLFEEFMQIKARLENEGLFDLRLKKPIPRYPRTIGVVTSTQAAALWDVLVTLKKRWPSCRVILYPTLVQGAEASNHVVKALMTASSRRECDVLLLVRGGGSLEDLRAFNTESVAHAIAACSMPVVSGIGHETDFTIADFTADARGATPTGATQLATPDSLELGQHLQHTTNRFRQALSRNISFLAQLLDNLKKSLVHPRKRIEAQRQHLSHLNQRLISNSQILLIQRRQSLSSVIYRIGLAKLETASIKQSVQRLHQRLHDSLSRDIRQRGAQISALNAGLSHLDPNAVLARGYSIVRGPDRQIITRPRQVKIGQELEINLANGLLMAEVIQSKPR